MRPAPLNVALGTGSELRNNNRDSIFKIIYLGPLPGNGHLRTLQTLCNFQKEFKKAAFF